MKDRDQSRIGSLLERFPKTIRRILDIGYACFRRSEKSRCTGGILRSYTRKGRNARSTLSMILFAFILDSHVQDLKHTRSPSDIQEPPASYCGYPRVYQSRINRFSSIRMNGTHESIHNRYKHGQTDDIAQRPVRKPRPRRSPARLSRQSRRPLNIL